MPARGLVVDGRRFARWMLAVAALLAFDVVACRAAPQAAPSNSSRASASAAPAGLSEPRPAAPDANTSLGDFSAIVNSFPEADVHEGIGREGFGAALREVLEAIARRGDAGAPPDIAFVVDRDTPEPLAGALVVAMARNRELLVTSGRFALVSCGRSDGMWKARVETPFGPDPYEVQRAAGRTDWSPEGGGLGPSWVGLAEASRLAWGAGARHIVLLTDVLPRREFLRTLPAPSPIDAAVRAAVGTWARGAGAKLHALLDTADLENPRTDPWELEKPRRGTDPALLVGLFHDARYARTDSRPALLAALESVLESSAEPGDARDVALLVDSTGLMGRSLSRLAHTRALLDRFVEGNGRRLALVQWGGAKPAIVALFTSRKSVVPKAIASLQPGPPGDLAKDLYGAIDLASRLPWAARARKTIIVLTAASTYSSDAYQNAIEWTYASKVSVLWIDPTRPLTGDW